jgi:hypothetical protein
MTGPQYIACCVALLLWAAGLRTARTHWRDTPTRFSRAGIVCLMVLYTMLLTNAVAWVMRHG